MRRAFRLGTGAGHVERAVDEELAFHIETRIQALMAQGMSQEEAQDAARTEFGNLHSVRDSCIALDKQRERKMSRADLLDQIGQDLRYAFRALRKARGMSTVAIVTLAVAIALLTTVFSILNTGFLRPLPYPDADRLVGINSVQPVPARPQPGCSVKYGQQNREAPQAPGGPRKEQDQIVGA